MKTFLSSLLLTSRELFNPRLSLLSTFGTLIGTLLFSLPISAERITLQQARTIAASYMKTTTTASLVKCKAQQAVVDGETLPIYIFSRGEGLGFVIVSGDDALPSVIGYTEQGDFDEDDLPPALQDMIDYYSSAAEALAASGTATSSPHRASASGTKDIATLMTSHWHQSWPYNNLCPYITGTTNRAATGCVATASSQIVYYWRKNLNERTQYATPQYGYGDAPATEDDVIPSGTPLKWDLMQDSYSGSDPEECTTAAATLVACVGMSGWLTYGSSTAGQIADQVGVLSGQFGLNGGTCVWKSSYSQSTWEKMIIQDLEAGRPILYSGVNSSAGGHAVVIDGYQVSTNLFHFNFGWGAGNGYDGYYTVDDDTGMNGFIERQGMVRNIYPKDNKLTGILSMDGDCLYSRVSNTVTAKVTNNGTLSQSGFYLYCLTGTNTPSSSSSAQASETTTVIEPGGSAQLTFMFTPNSTLTYTIYLCDANKNILDKIKDVESIATVADLTLNSLSVDDGGESEMVTVGGQEIEVRHVFNSKKANVTASFTNGEGGTFCTPSVQGIVYQLSDGEFTQSTTKTKKNVDFAVGATEDMVFDLTSLTDDVVYKFALAGTASTNRSYDINYATADSVIYFKLVGANLALTSSDDGNEMIVTGNYNATAFQSLAKDSTVSRYDMTQVGGLTSPLEAANKNALFYVDASQQVGGTNVIVDMVCDNLDLTPGYNFLPREDFKALTATYHATQAVGQFGTAILPFDAETPSGMFARKVNEVKNSYLNDVDSCNLELKGGTPYIILTGEPVDITASDAEVSINTPSLGTDTLRGTWTNIVATESQWVIDDEDSQYFNEYTGNVIPALTAYLEYTRSVRVSSRTYNTKDGKAKSLAQQIISALETYETYEALTSSAAQASFIAAIDEARDTLRSQPVTKEQTSQINALETAAETYVASIATVADNGYVDISNYIANPSFELGSTKNWTAVNASASKITGSLANYMAGADGSYVVYIKEGGRVEQTITGIENGVYQLVVGVGADYGNHITLYASTDSVTVEATDFGPMYLEDVTIENITISDNTLTIGVMGVEDWIKADNFRLYQISGDPTAVESISATAAPLRKGIYDLSGRKLNSIPTKGIYVIDGKRVVK